MGDVQHQTRFPRFGLKWETRQSFFLRVSSAQSASILPCVNKLATNDGPMVAGVFGLQVRKELSELS